MMKWNLVVEEGGAAIEKARRKPLHYSFILTTSDKDPWLVFAIARSTLDDHYGTTLEEETLEKANQPEEITKFINMSVTMQKLGFRSSNPDSPYLVTPSLFQRFFH